VRFSTRGVQKHHKKLFGENPCQKLLAEKVERFFFFFLSSFPVDFFLSRFWPFLCMRSSKTPQKLFGENPKKLREKKKKSFRQFPVDFFLSRFLAVSLHKEPKNTIKIFSKIGPKNHKKILKKVGR
jgi:hypothetical protein